MSTHQSLSPEYRNRPGKQHRRGKEKPWRLEARYVELLFVQKPGERFSTLDFENGPLSEWGGFGRYATKARAEAAKRAKDRSRLGGLKGWESRVVGPE